MKYFEKELETFETDYIKAFAEYGIGFINSAFFKEAASSSGKYHPNYAQGEGGLYRHTCAAIRFANRLFEIESVNKLFNLSPAIRDEIRTALIFHDSCKRGESWDNQYTVHEHPILASDFVDKLFQQYCDNGFNQEMYDELFIDVECIKGMISSHMGQWNTNKYSRTVLPRPMSPDEIFVCICDYLASRKDFEVIFED